MPTKKVLELLEGYALKLEELWVATQAIQTAIMNAEDKLGEIQNDFDILYDDVKILLEAEE